MISDKNGNGNRKIKEFGDARAAAAAEKLALLMNEVINDKNSYADDHETSRAAASVVTSGDVLGALRRIGGENPDLELLSISLGELMDGPGAAAGQMKSAKKIKQSARERAAGERAAAVAAEMERVIGGVCENKDSYVSRPRKDFSRSSKIEFKDVLKTILCMGGESLDRELLATGLDGLFGASIPTASAFCQRRAGVLPDALESIFRGFAISHEAPLTLRGHGVFADDGSALVYSEDEGDAECHFEGYNKIHVNVLYDVMNDIYADAILNPGHESGERRAAAAMAARFPRREGPKPIMTLDRGYEGWNLMVSLDKSGWYYLVRAKDPGSSGIISGLGLPQGGAFDVDVSLLLTRRQTKEVKAHPEIYRFLPSTTEFDYFGDSDYYPVQFRAVGIGLPDGGFVSLITNLPRDEWPPEALYNLYHMRWGVETSLRLLKNAECLKNLHSARRDFVMQETWAKLAMYNFSSECIQSVVGPEYRADCGDYVCKSNFTLLAQLCRRILRGCEKAAEVAGKLFLSAKTWVKKNRSFERGAIKRGPISYQYRMS
jgi:hypothetical protein